MLEGSSAFSAKHPDVECGNVLLLLLPRAAVPNALTLSEIQTATDNDQVIQSVLESLRTGHWDRQSPLIRPYYSLRHELTPSDHLLLRNQNIVIPSTLRSRTLDLAHAGHQGATRTKQRLSSKVWWPGMSTAAETLCYQCIPCQACTASTPIRPPCQPTPPSSKPWARLFADLYGPIPGGQHVLVIIDQLTRYPVTHVFNSSPSSTQVTSVFRSMFCAFGTPTEVVTDNGPQFRAEHFNSFLRQWGVTHRTTPPLWPQANGAVERLNATIGKTLRTARMEGRDLREALDCWLLAYRTTPHPATGQAPASLLFGRPIRDTIPNPTQQSDLTDTAAKDLAYRRQRCDSANTSRHATTDFAPIRQGQQVLRRNEYKTNKLDPIWDPNPWTVTQSTPSTVTIQNPATTQQVTRHPSFVKLVIIVTPPADETATPPDQLPSPTPTQSPTLATPQPEPDDDLTVSDSEPPASSNDPPSPQPVNPSDDSIASRPHPRAASAKPRFQQPKSRRRRKRHRSRK